MIRRWAFPVAVLLVLAAPLAAAGSQGWGWPVEGCVGLRYGQAYAGADGRACTHGGLDVLADPGSGVLACTSGEVTFAGLVPGCAGGRVWAVTVRTGDGLSFTVTPLASVRVSRGAHVGPGAPLGVLAAAGDASDTRAHLHLGVKRGTASLDPQTFLGTPVGASAPEPPAVAAPVPAPASSAVPRAAPHAPAQPTVHVPATEPGSVPAASAAIPRVSVAGAVPDPAAALRGALGALGQEPQLQRVEQVASPAVLDPERAGADLTRARGRLLRIGVGAGALLVALGCVWAVLRSARAAGGTAGRAPASAPAHRVRG